MATTILRIPKYLIFLGVWRGYNLRYTLLLPAESTMNVETILFVSTICNYCYAFGHYILRTYMHFDVRITKTNKTARYTIIITLYFYDRNNVV